MAKAVIEIGNTYGLNNVVQAMVFDTTASNTGCWKGMYDTLLSFYPFDHSLNDVPGKITYNPITHYVFRHPWTNNPSLCRLGNQLGSDSIFFCLRTINLITISTPV